MIDTSDTGNGAIRSASQRVLSPLLGSPSLLDSALRTTMASFVPKKRVCSLFFFLISNLAPRTRAPLDPAQPRLPFHDLVTHLCDFSSFCHFFEARENLVVSSHFLLVLSPPTPPAYMRLTRFRGQARCLPRSFRIAASSILHLFRATPEALVPRVTQGTVCGKIRCGQRV